MARWTVFVNRAAIVALATFASALVGFGLQHLLPAAYVADSKGMIGSVVGLVALLLSLVLGLLTWTSHGPFTAHQSQMQTVGRSIAHLDMTLKEYGPEAMAGRAILFKIAVRTRQRFSREQDNVHIVYGDLQDDLEPMRAFLDSLRPASDEQRQRLAAANELLSTVVETQVTMVRSLADPVPGLLLTIVAGWACLLFFSYGLQWTNNALSIVMAGLGGVSVANAVFLILEMSHPSVGLMTMPQSVFDRLLKALAAEQ